MLNLNNVQGVLLAFTTNSTITKNSITNNRYGISLRSSSNNTIFGNNITNNGGGIGVSYSSNYNSISGNNITNNGYGIQFIYSSYNEISGNSITNNTDGINLGSSSNWNSISGNNIAANGRGILLVGCGWNTVSGNNIAANSVIGIQLDGYCNLMSGNSITNNGYGIVLGFCRYDYVYHNNFVDNGEHVFSLMPLSYPNVWDAGYPSGGNYWSGHVTVDDYSGINQDEPGSDGIVDEPYIIDDNNRDNYPLVEPWRPVIPAAIDVAPDTLNLKSQGQWITSFMQLPAGYNPEDISVSTILLNETITPVLDPKYEFVTNSSEYIVDHNGDGILERMVKFNRTEVASWICNDLGIQFGNVAFTIAGELDDGTPFEGADVIFVTIPGDIRGPEFPLGSGLHPPDGVVDGWDYGFIGLAYGRTSADPDWEVYKIADIRGPAEPDHPPDGVVDGWDYGYCGLQYGNSVYN